MDQTPITYIPMDRRQALAHGETLPKRAHGAALFADVSGFTPMTEALTRTLGARLGAEELTRQLNRVYDALIAEIDNYHGSVIGFSGDAITCWFAGEGDAAPLRAVSCAGAMQRAMTAFAQVALPGGESVSLAVKTALATGPVRRFLVGDPAIHQLDALAGQTLQRMSHAEHVSNRGEITVDAETAALLGERIEIGEWRTLDETGEWFAVISRFLTPMDPSPWPLLSPSALTEAQVRPWLLPAVYERLAAGLGEFLTELRPAVALFLRFSGIDYDQDNEAGAKLGSYICWIQSIITRYDGILVDLTIGDKGSYLYAAFGAPLAHEDDARRAVSAALNLCAPPPELAFIEPVQIGISQGTMRAGTCGGSTRRTYAVLGDEVNLAARLMQNAEPGTVLASGHARESADRDFTWQELPPLRVKGKSQPVPVARPLHESDGGTGAETFTGSLVGRDSELAQLIAFLQPLFAHRFAGLLAVHGEPGMGKSRLVHELKQRLTNNQAALDSPSPSQPEGAAGRAVSWFLCPTDQILRQSLNPFKYFLRSYFGYAAAQPESENKARFDQRLSTLLETLSAPDGAELRDQLDSRRSYLGALLDLYWNGSPYARAEPKLRFENSLIAFRALIHAESLHQPVILHIEDAQWLDSDSVQLIQALTQDAHGYPFALLVTSRYRDDGSRITLELAADIPQAAIDLTQLSPEGIRAMAAQALGGAISDDLAAFLREKTDGNPFFVEQLALDLHERGLLHNEDAVWGVAQAELAEVPAGISAVLIARLDRLAAHIKAIVQIAAVVGHEFEMALLATMLRDDEHLVTKVKAAEAEAIWSALNEGQYLFRHALLRDAAYDMQLQERLRSWHTMIGQTLEQLYPDDLPARAARLAYHYGRAQDRERECRYSKMAGETAAARFANSEAIAYLSRTLELTPESELAERYKLLLARESVYDLQGAREPQAGDLSALKRLADQLDDNRRRAEVALRRAPYFEVTGDYAAAAEAAHHAITLAQLIRAPQTEATAYYQLGRALWRTDAAAARRESEWALMLARRTHLREIEAKTLLILGNIAYGQDDYAESRARFEEALRLRHDLGDRHGEGLTLNNLGSVALDQADYEGAADYYEQSLRLCRETGDRRNEGIVLGNLGRLAMIRGDFAGARTYYERALRLNRETGDRRSETFALNNLSEIAARLGDYTAAQTYNEAALRLSRKLGDSFSEVAALACLSLIRDALGNPKAAQESATHMLRLAEKLDARAEQARAWMLLGQAVLELGQVSEAAGAYTQAVALYQEVGQHSRTIEAKAGLARASLSAGNPDEAARQTGAILSDVQSGSLDGADDPIRVYLTCYQVLNAAHDPRGAASLETAYRLLEKWASRIADADARRQFLERVPSHRELMMAWAAAGARVE